MLPHQDGRKGMRFHLMQTGVVGRRHEIEAGMAEKDRKEKDAEMELRTARERVQQAEAKVQEAQAQQLQTDLPK